ncbi:ABC transporter substrate-binding protein [Nocardioides sp. KIGAM211]|uniref:ABC transporter substrate-binding protein n=1 Tax=Nocardioides luti TaxID=2761101 RepID=A0A7X0VB35_9ACTN|nr:ABC transporter substrate-binding protein [Nocardioides luti]MBB6627552.1 ABC transporter substrate-binding protein [Nocardioides luti]
MKARRRVQARGSRGYRWAAALLAGVLAAGLLAACGSGGDGDRDSSSKSGGTLTVAITYPPSSFELNTQCSSEVFQLAYEPLIRVSPTGGYEPAIAESWAYSKNNTVFTMKIRKGVKFQDGTDVTVASVVDTLNYYKSVPGIIKGYIEPWTVKAVGDDSVQISYDEPFIGIEDILSDVGMCNNGMIISEAGLKNPDKLKTEMFGAGPYEYVASESNPGDHYTFKPNPNYYDKSRQNWDEVVLRVIPDPTTALNALKTGQVQVDVVGGETLVDQAKSAGFDVTLSTYYGMCILVSDTEGVVSKPLADVRVRQAIALALDREGIAAASGPEAKPQDQIAQIDGVGYDPDLPSRYTYNLDEAKRLMAEAGYPDGFDVEMLWSSDDVPAKTPLTAAVEELSKIGINIKLKSIPFGELVTARQSKKYPLSAASFGLYGDLPSNAYRLYKLPYADVFNVFGNTDPEIDKAYNALVTSSESNLDENARLFNEAMGAAAWVIPVVALPQYAFSDGIDIGDPGQLGYYAINSWKRAS